MVLIVSIAWRLIITQFNGQALAEYNMMAHAHWVTKHLSPWTLRHEFAVPWRLRVRIMSTTANPCFGWLDDGPNLTCHCSPSPLLLSTTLPYLHLTHLLCAHLLYICISVGPSFCQIIRSTVHAFILQRSLSNRPPLFYIQLNFSYTLSTYP